MSDGRITDSVVHKYAWDYFSLHAGQRISLFNFYISMSALLTAGMVATLQDKFRAPLLGAALGVMLVLVSFLFWKLDERTRYLIKNAEQALADIETRFPTAGENDPHATQLIRREVGLTKEVRALADNVWTKQMSYATVFRWVYASVALLGVAGVLASLWWVPF